MKLSTLLTEKLSNPTVRKPSTPSPVVEKTITEDDPIFGVKENSRWARRLKKSNPEAYERLKNWD